MQNQFDEKTLDQVMLDLNDIVKKWESLDLNIHTMIVALLQFALELVFKYAIDTQEALAVISEMLLTKLENGELDPNIIETMFDIDDSENGSIN